MRPPASELGEPQKKFSETFRAVTLFEDKYGVKKGPLNVVMSGTNAVKEEYSLELLYEVMSLVNDAAGYKPGVPMRQLMAQKIIEAVLKEKKERKMV